MVFVKPSLLNAMGLEQSTNPSVVNVWTAAFLLVEETGCVPSGSSDV